MTTRELESVTLEEVLARHKRVVIAGGPKTGKTTLARAVTDRPVYHTDDYSYLPWAEIPKLVNEELAGKKAYVLEGVQAGRALRKGLKPDVVVYLTEPRAPRSKGQMSMGKAVHTIFRDWLSSSPGVPVEYHVDRVN